jgi:hypothetical protein
LAEFRGERREVDGCRKISRQRINFALTRCGGIARSARPEIGNIVSFHGVAGEANLTSCAAHGCWGQPEQGNDTPSMAAKLTRPQRTRT